MASVEYGKDSVELKMFNDYWKYVKHFAKPENGNQKYWDDLIEKGTKLIEKYQSDYLYDMVQAFISDMERKAVRNE